MHCANDNIQGRNVDSHDSTENVESVRNSNGEVEGLRQELTSLRQEYLNNFDRSNKLDNKVYITITFCGFLFVFITNVFGGIAKIQMPKGGLAVFLTAAYLLSCLAFVIAYVSLLIYFMKLLQPEKLVRIDPAKLENLHLETTKDAETMKKLIDLYRETINLNLEKLAERCDEFVKGLRFVYPTVILAFTSYGFLLLLKMFQ
ncbi:MAG: hypothetical protein Q4B26_09070 [Eubacteriales bacterium]|nr:hypothetical protein [Eubacteriales bacterium]